MALGRTDDGGLGWPPSEFWGATMYDFERAVAISMRKNGALTKDDADRMSTHLAEHRYREADERAARGDTRSHKQVVEEMTRNLLAR